MDELIKKSAEKLIPKIYDDALQPSIIEIGKSIKSTVELALKPYNGLIWSVDKSIDWLTNTISKQIEKNNIKRIKRPNIDTTIRVIQGIQTTGAIDEPLPRFYFANLLFSDMSLENESIHPSYVEILKQITKEECRILCVVASEPLTIRESSSSSILQPNVTGAPYFSYHRYELMEDIGYHESDNYLFVHNLERLGIIRRKFEEVKHPVPFKEAGQVIDYHEKEFLKFKEKNKDDKKCPEEITIHVGTIMTTDFGQSFIRACGAHDIFNRQKRTFSMPDWFLEVEKTTGHNNV